MFEAAVIGFERAISDGGLVSGALYFNLGNAFARLDRHGRAIEHYLHADRLRPGDANVRRNLGVVRRRVETLVAGAESGVLGNTGVSTVLQPIVWAQRAAPGSAKLCLFVTSAALFWGLMGVRLWRASVGASRWPARRLVAVPFVVALLASASVAWDTVGTTPRVAVVVDQPLIARTGPDRSYGRRFNEALSPGVEMRIVEERGGWLRGRLANNREVWTPFDAVAVVPTR